MRRHTFLWLAAACLFVAASASASASADEVSDHDRFKLWNGCKSMYLVVEEMSDRATAIGLTAEEIQIAVRSRLRAARLYSDRAHAASSFLYINVDAVSPAFNVSVHYRKVVRDTATNIQGSSMTWFASVTGTHGSTGSNFILSSVSKQADRFIDEYLRVNADACK